MRPTLVRLVRDGFVKRNLEQFSLFTARAVSVGGTNAPIPEVEFHNFREPSSLKAVKIFSDRGLGGFSTAAMDIERFTPEELPPDYQQSSMDEELPTYARFRGNISLELPRNRPEIERSGFAAWRLKDPKWTLFGKARFNCECLAYMALRVKSDGSKYFVNLQSDSLVPTDLYQHRLFARTPGEWETVYAEIPFQEFVKTNQGVVLKRQGSMRRDNFTTVGLGLIDGIPGPFDICIDRIWATNEREVRGETREYYGTDPPGPMFIP